MLLYEPRNLEVNAYVLGGQLHWVEWATMGVNY